MWLNHATCTIGKHSCWSHCRREEEVHLSFLLLERSRSVYCVSDAIRSIGSPYCWWGMNFGLNWVFRSNHFSPLLEGSISYNFHTSAHITLKECTDISRISVIRVGKEIRSSSLIESTHFKFGDNETALIDWIYNLASMHINIWFDHRESCLFSFCKWLSSESIAIIYKLELSSMYCQNGTDEELILGDTFARHSLEEHSSVFQIVLFHHSKY